MFFLSLRKRGRIQYSFISLVTAYIFFNFKPENLSGNTRKKCLRLFLVTIGMEG